MSGRKLLNFVFGRERNGSFLAKLQYSSKIFFYFCVYSDSKCFNFALLGELKMCPFIYARLHFRFYFLPPPMVLDSDSNSAASASSCCTSSREVIQDFMAPVYKKFFVLKSVLFIPEWQKVTWLRKKELN